MGKLASLALDSLPTFKCLVPSLGITITMRSFVVKEQKLLMIAKQAEGDKLESIVNAVSQLIQNCITIGDVTVSELPSFDIEYMFIQLFMHSSGTSQTKTFYVCKNPVLDAEGNATVNDQGDEVTCDQPNGVVVNLKGAKVSTSEIKTGIIDVKSQSIEKVIFKYPNFEQITRHDIAIADEDVDTTLKIYSECLTYVYKADGSVMKYGVDFEADDAFELLELMPQQIFDEVLAFFMNIPTVVSHADFACRKCGHTAKIALRGLNDFFS